MSDHIAPWIAFVGVSILILCSYYFKRNEFLIVGRDEVFSKYPRWGIVWMISSVITAFSYTYIFVYFLLGHEFTTLFIVGLYTMLFGELMWAIVLSTDYGSIVSPEFASLTIASSGALLMLITADKDNALFVASTSYIVFHTLIYDNIIWTILQYRPNSPKNVIGSIYVFYYGLLIPTIVFLILSRDAITPSAYIAFAVAVSHFVVGGISKYQRFTSFQGIYQTFQERYSHSIPTIADSLFIVGGIGFGITAIIEEPNVMFSSLAIGFVTVGNMFCMYDWINRKNGEERGPDSQMLMDGF